MFIGHFAVGLAAKRLAPRTSLGWLMLAPLLADALWPLFLILGLESVRIDPGNTVVTPLDLHDYPYSHSLVGTIGWSLLLGAAYLLLRRDRRAALVIALGVFSHFVLDFVTHRPDMPLYPGSATSVGLGLWNSRAGTMAVEIPMFVVGIWLYVRSTTPLRRRGSVGLWLLVALLSLMYLADMFGPPPPSVQAIKVFGIMGWLFIPWAWGIDRNRCPTEIVLTGAASSR
jgi:membrane-bound metal-dependent hydrolase YbcI (DUF457 family)